MQQGHPHDNTRSARTGRTSAWFVHHARLTRLIGFTRTNLQFTVLEP